jgi:hypothetical protein
LHFEVDLVNPVGESCGDNIMCDGLMVQNGLDKRVLGYESQNSTMPIVLLFNHQKVMLSYHMNYCIVNLFSYCVALFHREVNQKGLQRNTNTYKCHSRQEICTSSLHSIPIFFSQSVELVLLKIVTLPKTSLLTS